METITFKIRGESQLLMHNGQLADPLNPYTKAMKSLTSKRKKTDSDHEAISYAEYEGGLYRDSKGEPCLPGEIIEAAIVEASKIDRSKKLAQSGLIVTTETASLKYEGPRESRALYEAGFVKKCNVRVQMARIIRTRPMFPTGWETSFDVTFDPETLNQAQVIQFVATAGAKVGVGDWRPKYGRFEVISAK
jgi:hypothetical protein